MGFTVGTKGTHRKRKTGSAASEEHLLCEGFVCKAGRELLNRTVILGEKQKITSQCRKGS